MKFRPCIDLHQAKVKQIVGSSLKNDRTQNPVTNFVSSRPPSWYAELYKADNLTGGHVIRLGAGNDTAARSALKAWPGGLQLGGGINLQNAAGWLDAGAEKVIVTSWIFSEGEIQKKRLQELVAEIGKDKLILDLSCKKKKGKFWIMTDSWNQYTQVEVTPETLDMLAGFCAEFLLHAVDVEGKKSGICEDLVSLLGSWDGIPVTYAGGIHSLEDIETIKIQGRGRVDFTVGSALDIFGGSQLKYRELVNHQKDNFK